MERQRVTILDVSPLRRLFAGTTLTPATLVRCTIEPLHQRSDNAAQHPTATSASIMRGPSIQLDQPCNAQPHTRSCACAETQGWQAVSWAFYSWRVGTAGGGWWVVGGGGTCSFGSSDWVARRQHPGHSGHIPPVSGPPRVSPHCEAFTSSGGRICAERRVPSVREML